MLNINLNGKTVVVTGAAGGIGQVVAEKIVEAGGKVVCLDMVAGNVTGVEYHVCNITKSAEVNAVVDLIGAKGHRVAGLVNCAGITRDALINKMTEQMWDQVIDVNLKGTFLVTQALVPHFDKEGTSIVNISSIVGTHGNIGQTNYAATKAGVIGMTQSWAKELPRKGDKIRVNAICPGFTRTPMTETVPQEVMDKLFQLSPVKRMAEPREIAEPILFLLSDMSTYVNGQAIEVTGGMVF